MTVEIFVAIITIFVLFILFLVISKTMNNTINVLVKLQYILKKEWEIKSEALEIKKLMDARAEEEAAGERARRKAESSEKQ
ncbi:hypothetical protein CHISP_0079 [Chitinispirillum alkaliphilum]|nr:hypothetical protein CHISP_0079 [Chitinispirillum alkaliphilum]